MKEIEAAVSLSKGIAVTDPVETKAQIFPNESWIGLAEFIVN